MKNNINVVRAITAEFGYQFIKPFVWIIICVLATLVIITGLLTYFFSPWWLFMLIPIVIIGMVVSITWLVIRIILQTLSPQLDVSQKMETKAFVTKLEQGIETLQTPYPIIIFYILRDILLQKDDGFVYSIILQTQELKPDFEKLRSLF